jgi:cytidine deaminase
MHKGKEGFEYTVYENMAELPDEEVHLLNAAISAREKAYAPYSGFRVGAAILLQNGEVVIGNNQENASYPSGLCAERVAVYQAGARFPDIPIEAIAISAASDLADVTRPAAPCGNCRQAIMEYEDKQGSGIRILMAGASGVIYRCEAMAHLLPFAFGRSDLKVSHHVK